MDLLDLQNYLRKVVSKKKFKVKNLNWEFNMMIDFYFHGTLTRLLDFIVYLNILEMLQTSTWCVKFTNEIKYSFFWMECTKNSWQTSVLTVNYLLYCWRFCCWRNSDFGIYCICPRKNVYFKYSCVGSSRKLESHTLKFNFRMKCSQFHGG